MIKARNVWGILLGEVWLSEIFVFLWLLLLLYVLTFDIHHSSLRSVSNSSLYCSLMCNVQPPQAPSPEFCAHQTVIPETCSEERQAVCGEGHSLDSTGVARVTLQLCDVLLQTQQQNKTNNHWTWNWNWNRVYHGGRLSDIKQPILADGGQPYAVRGQEQRGGA